MYKIIEGYENYLVSETGRVVNKKFNRELSPYMDKSGYLSVELFKKGKGKQFLVHRLVAQTFIPNPEGKTHVHHKDSDRRNNNVDNLEWVTNKENMEQRDLKESRGRVSKRRIIKLYKSKRKWDSVEDFLVEIVKL
jgi:hypothetical protein